MNRVKTCTYGRTTSPARTRRAGVCLCASGAHNIFAPRALCAVTCVEWGLSDLRPLQPPRPRACRPAWQNRLTAATSLSVGGRTLRVHPGGIEFSRCQNAAPRTAS
eukprot:684019-Prymnesium_polylepis.1